MLTLFNTRKRKIRKALKRALIDYNKETILEIMNSDFNDERYGWSNGAEFLNRATSEEAEVILRKMK